jgi:hypothetical protein
MSFRECALSAIEWIEMPSAPVLGRSSKCTWLIPLLSFSKIYQFMHQHVSFFSYLCYVLHRRETKPVYATGAGRKSYRIPSPFGISYKSEREQG